MVSSLLFNRYGRYVRPLFGSLFILSLALVIVACQDVGETDGSNGDTADEGTPDTELTEDSDDGSAMSDDDGEMNGDTSDDGMMTDADEMGDDASDDDMMMGDDHSDDAGMGDSMMGLGGTAETDVLAEHLVETLPTEPLAWVAYEFASSDEATSSVVPGEPGFVYAAEGTHTLTVAGEEVVLEPEQAVFTARDVEYVYEGDGLLWDIRLTAPDSDAPDGIENGTLVFDSGPLEGLPDEPAQLNFVRVELPPDSETSVHTHPGPEYIYVTEGEIIYENELTEPEPMQPGDDHSMPAETAVQKRNPPEAETAVFLSWFVVDPDRPFAPEASFE